MSEDKALGEQIRLLERRLALIQAVDQVRDLTVQDVQAMLTALAGLITDTLQADLCLLSLVEEESGELSLKTIVDRSGLATPEVLETIQERTEQALEQEQILSWNAGDEAALQKLPHGVIIPIVLNGERLGAITLANRNRPFSEEEIILLDLAEDQIDSALTHARTYARLVARNRELETLYRVDRLRDMGLPFDEMLTAVLRELCQVLEAEAGFVMLFSDRGQELELRASTHRDFFTASAQADLIRRVAHQAIREAHLVERTELSPQVRSLLCAPLILHDTIIGVFGAVNRRGLPSFTHQDRRLLHAIISQMDTAIFESLEKRRLRRVLERSVDPRVMEMLLNADQDFLRGQRAEATILFSDMRGFTNVAERTPPETLVARLNEHLEAMTEAILAHQGTLDKFVGDAVMALFGVPWPMEDHALRAVRTAMQMQKAQQHLMEHWVRIGWEAVPIGIGINTGPMIAGEIGTLRRSDYTVIGDAVNLASRLCDLAQPNQILISQATYERVREAVEARPLEPVIVKGKSRPVMIYEVLAV